MFELTPEATELPFVQVPPGAGAGTGAGACAGGALLEEVGVEVGATFSGFGLLLARYSAFTQRTT